MTNPTVEVIDGNVERVLYQLKRKMGQHGLIRDIRRQKKALRPGKSRRLKHSKTLRARWKANAQTQA